MRAKQSIFVVLGQGQHEKAWEKHRILAWTDEKRNDGNEKKRHRKRPGSNTQQ
jgi:hypothetical protein